VKLLPIVTLLSIVVLVAGCGTSSASPTPRATAAAAPLCDPKATGSATTYPGWPGADPQVIPTLVSSELAVGPNRFLFQVLDLQNKPLAAPDVGVDLAFYDLAHDPAKAAGTAPATFLQISAGRGLYRTNVDFSCAGDWGVSFTVHQAGVADRSARAVATIRQTTSTPPLGSHMPPFDTPTATTPEGIKAIATDPTPDADFYRTSVRQALADDRPFLLVIATPLFCKTATCGPALDLIQTAAGPFKDRVTFINVEPYVLHDAGGTLQPVLDASGNLQPIQMVDDLGLNTEPYTIAVDRTGVVIAKFEGVMGRDEIDQVLAQLAK
jgi:hypothetical protein